MARYFKLVDNYINIDMIAAIKSVSVRNEHGTVERVTQIILTGCDPSVIQTAHTPDAIMKMIKQAEQTSG